MPNLIDLTGNVYGRLTVIYLQPRINGRIIWLCKCSCGKECSVRASNLKKGTSQSCGCLQKEATSKSRMTHGDKINRKQSKEYTVWCNIRARCKETKNPLYGGRGIEVCDRWINSFDAFLEDMGRAPSPNHSIDRKNNDGNYEPGNCRWANDFEQANNTRKNRLIEYKGEIKTISIWCRELNFPIHLAYQRANKGWYGDQIFETPKLKSRYAKGSQTLGTPLKNSEN